MTTTSASHVPLTGSSIGQNKRISSEALIDTATQPIITSNPSVFRSWISAFLSLLVAPRWLLVVPHTDDWTLRRACCDLKVLPVRSRMRPSSLTWAIVTSDDRRSCPVVWSAGSLFRCCPGLPWSPGRRRRRTRRYSHCGTRSRCCDGTIRGLTCPGLIARSWPRLPGCSRRRCAPTGLSRGERCCAGTAG